MDPQECSDSPLDCPAPPPPPAFEELCEDPAISGMFPECRGLSPAKSVPFDRGGRSSSPPPTNQSAEPKNACIDNPSLPGCPQIPESLRCMVVPTPVGGAGQVCLDENNDVWDMADQFETIVDQMTTSAFCNELQIDNATELMARTAAAGLFVANCIALGAKAGGVAGVTIATVTCGALSTGAAYKIVSACQAKWGSKW